MGKFYPKGTLTEGEQPSYYESVFYASNGELQTNIPNAVENAERTLKSMTDEESDLAFKVVQYCKENPDAVGDMDKVIMGMNITNPRTIQFIKNNLNKKLNDIKIAKKDSSWTMKWQKRKMNRRKAKNEFMNRTGISLSKFNKAVAMVCGKPRRNVRLSKEAIAQYQGCKENVLNKMRNKKARKIREEISEAPVNVKSEITNLRQDGFANQVINRQGTGQFAGRREDGRNNNYTETLVSEGLV